MKKFVNLHNKGWQFVFLLILSLIWGASFILMKRGLEVFTSQQLAALRVSIAALLILPFTIKNLRLISRKNLKSFLIAGYAGIALPALLFALAQKHIDSSTAGILNSLTPLFTLIFGLLLYKNKYRLFNFAGVFLGLVGASSLIIKTRGWQIDNVNYYALLVVLATALYGINVNEIKNHLSHLNGLQITSLSFAFIGPLAIIYLFFAHLDQSWTHPLFWKSLSSVALLAALGSVVAVILFNHFLQFTTAVFASSVTYIIPVFAIFWGVHDGEAFGFYEWLSVLIILAGVWLVNRNGNNN